MIMVSVVSSTAILNDPGKVANPPAFTIPIGQYQAIENLPNYPIACGGQIVDRGISVVVNWYAITKYPIVRID